MNEMLRQEILDDLGLFWCPVVNNFVSDDCFNHCFECPEFIAMEKFYFLDFEKGDEPF